MAENNEIYDLGIIGGGPAGYSCAIFAAKQGKKVILFEKSDLGGTCLNKGCIPTKTFLHVSEVYNSIQNSQSLGINAGDVSVDFKQVAEYKSQVVEKLRKSLDLTIKNLKIKVVNCEAERQEQNIIEADGLLYNCEKIIVATGAKPKQLKGLEFDGKFILSSDDVLNLSNLPRKVLIAGSGAIGIEWARIFSNFGVEVILVELAKNLVPTADIEVSKRVERIFKQKKIKFYTETFIKSCNKGDVELSNGEIVQPDFVLVAVGREPVKIEDEEVCIGDACGEIQLAHYAIHQAKELILNIPFDKNFVPSVIYGTPEIAWVGIKEQDMDESCYKVVLPVSALGKAHCDDETDGFIKLIVSGGYIKGAHIVSKEASALIHQVIIAMQNNIGVADLQKVCFAHPTYSEGLFETLMRIAQ